MELKKLQEVYTRLQEAVCPEDFFGELIGSEEEQMEQLKKIYRPLVNDIYPDFYIDQGKAVREMATDATGMLNDLNDKATEKIKNGSYGQRTADTGASIFKFATAKREYIIRSTVAEGDVSMVYSGTCSGFEGSESNVVFKLVKEITDNDLAMNEIKILKLFQSEPGPQSKHLPFLLDTFKNDTQQIGIILRYFDGFDMHSIREKYPQGVDPKHAAWMLGRLLSVVGYSHSQGIIHGNIEPSHVLIRPRDHNIMLFGWSYGVVSPKSSGDQYKTFNEIYGAPEIPNKPSPNPSSDIYSIAKTMIYVLGGDPANNTMPSSVPKKFQLLLQAMVLRSPLQRLQDAWKIYTDVAQLRNELWGKHEFIEFKM